MPINPFRLPQTFVAGAVLCSLVGCEAARVAQPQSAPSPAENTAAAARALGLPPSAAPELTAGLAQRVQGWDAPSAPAPGSGAAKLDPAVAAELAARAERMERELRASIAKGNGPR